MIDPNDENLPSGDEDLERQGEESRRQMDDIPPPGTDPLHEGP
jgi:hypothetical protein